MSTIPVFFDKVTTIEADVLNVLCQTVYGPLASATSVADIYTALGLGQLAKQSPSNVVLTGGSLDGVLIGYNGNVNAKFQTAFVAATPTAPTHAANKQYVDAQIAAAGMNPNYLRDNYLALAGGVMTGAITLHADPTIPLHPATKRYVDQVAAGYVTTASLNTTVESLASLTYVDSLLAQQANRQMYHDSFTMNGSSNTLPLRAVPAGDVIAWQAGIPVPATQISVNRDQLLVTFTFNPTGAVDLLYFSASGSGAVPTGYLARSGGTMTGPLILARDPALPLEAATKQYVDAKLSDYTLPVATAAVLGGIKVGANLTVAVDGTLSAIATQYTLPVATSSTLGGVKVGSSLVVGVDGVLDIGPVPLTFQRKTNSFASIPSGNSSSFPLNLPSDTTAALFYLVKTTPTGAVPSGGYSYDVTITSGAATVYKAVGLSAAMYDNVPFFTEASGSYTVTITNHGADPLSIDLAAFLSATNQ